MNPTPPLSVSIAALQAGHNRTNFESGAAELDRYLRLQAGQDAKRKVAAPFVLLDQDQKLLGYYTLSAYSVRLTELHPETAKKLPRYPVLPATLLGRLAVSREQQGRKLGQFLLIDALKRSWENTREIGSVGVLVHALDETAASFYVHHEFRPLLEQPRQLFLAMATIKKLFVG